jgi:hypothetical protein
MLPIAGSTLPTSHATLAEAIKLGFARHGVTPRELSVEGGVFPRIETIRLDLSGTKVTREQGVIPATETSATDRIEVARIGINAAPIEFEGAPVEFNLHATAATLALAQGANSFLVPVNAADGEVNVIANRSDLERLAHSLVVAAAAKQGIEIKKTRLEVTSTGPRSLSFRAEVTAKMFIMSATVALSGRLDIDQELNARLSELSCRGDGMIASAANALLKPHFHKIQDRPIALTSFALGDLKLRDVSLQTGETIRLHGVFGSAA